MKQERYTVLRIPRQIYDAVIADMYRPHSFAAERVGFISTATTSAGSQYTIITATAYHPIPDDEYIDDPSVGAKINTNAMLTAMQRIISTGHGCLHVHLHDHNGKPGPSSTDLKSLPDVARSFLNADPKTACGYLILSKDHFFCSVYEKGKKTPSNVDQITLVGYPMKLCYSKMKANAEVKELYSRQTFLGSDSEGLFKKVRIGIVGLGGGGSHIAQQLGHIGITHFIVFDSDHIELSNLNRLIGAWFTDIIRNLKKTKIIRRLIKRINPLAKVRTYSTNWQEHADELKKCDIIIGCIDSYEGRQHLESACRRSLIPLIDIGMDVHEIPDNEYAISGQVILSMPGQPCMTCFNFLDEDKLTEEIKKYGAVGARPQVVWPNGVLASTAVGVVVDLITGWSLITARKVYLIYDGNEGHITDHPQGKYCPKECNHYPLNNTGDAIFKKL